MSSEVDDAIYRRARSVALISLCAPDEDGGFVARIVAEHSVGFNRSGMNAFAFVIMTSQSSPIRDGYLQAERRFGLSIVPATAAGDIDRMAAKVRRREISWQHGIPYLSSADAVFFCQHAGHHIVDMGPNHPADNPCKHAVIFGEIFATLVAPGAPRPAIFALNAYHELGEIKATRDRASAAKPPDPGKTTKRGRIFSWRRKS